MTIGNMLSRLITLGSMVAAIVVGLMFSQCNKEMSTWLLVKGFMTPILVIVMLVLFCLALPAALVAVGDGPTPAVACLLIPSVIGFFGIIIFSIAWTIYGAVVFFPAASGPYPECADGKDGMVLVVTGTVIVALSFLFCCFPGFSMGERRNINIRSETNFRNVESGEDLEVDVTDSIPKEDYGKDGLGKGLKGNGFVDLALLAIEHGKRRG